VLGQCTYLTQVAYVVTDSEGIGHRARRVCTQRRGGAAELRRAVTMVRAHRVGSYERILLGGHLDRVFVGKRLPTVHKLCQRRASVAGKSSSKSVSSNGKYHTDKASRQIHTSDTPPIAP
jgi:hypothetical protein